MLCCRVSRQTFPQTPRDFKNGGLSFEDRNITCGSSWFIADTGHCWLTEVYLRSRISPPLFDIVIDLNVKAVKSSLICVVFWSHLTYLLKKNVNWKEKEKTPEKSWRKHGSNLIPSDSIGVGKIPCAGTLYRWCVFILVLILLVSCPVPRSVS